MIINRIRVMPFIPSIIQGEKDYTKLIDVQKRSDKNYYEILGKGSMGNKELAISVILTDTKKDDVLYISIFSNEIKENRKPRSPRPLRKSASRAKAVVTPCIEAVELPVLFQPALERLLAIQATMVIIVKNREKVKSQSQNLSGKNMHTNILKTANGVMFIRKI